ncbi:hypothetical protein CEG14_24240 [Bordetella genomosp. 1]|uniref:DUF4390 domain-containing protein n=1 Tax=Bordetella genomosp. 1 TaxID=1395607 RepID=A0A261RUS4_9BORD|nr:DUF4390 domain-containing protein [Bordetella genomosp. 1]MDQ8033954.1 DUF4390 domain-containing protein [Bordetella sp.]OZI28033.1 hypothetical protein CEG14_24240 [Bordetella genomosp. 1]OZI68133.1 hypothetical protein CAL27_01280 [Bordetella genomosp. 1]
MKFRSFSALLLSFALLFGLAGGQLAYADPGVTHVTPEIRDGKLVIDADVDFPLNEQLRDAASRGLSLYFTADVTITRARWYWFDATLVDQRLTWRITYNALTRQWRAGQDELSLPVGSLDDAMDLVRRIRGWQVADADQFEAGQRYEGQIRVRLDTSLLPRPFQVNALNSSSWSPATPWTTFSFTLTDPS